MQKPIVLSWDLVTRASLREAWAAMSDTDRFNRVAEAGFTFTPGDASRDGARTQGTIKKLGLTVSWDEEPFSYRAPHWFRIERRFHSGPAERLVANARLSRRAEGGTRIEYALEITPRGFFSRTILGIDLRATTERKVGAALKLLVATLDQETPVEKYAGVPRQLDAEADKRLARGIELLRPSPYADRLAAFVRAAPERDQARISASALAGAWQAQLDDVVDLLLAATDVGVLSMTLDLLCPACQVPRRELGPGAGEVHCDACGIRYDATFPELCAVHFRPSPDIRALDVKTECIGSPAQSVHILAQETLDPGAETDLATDLEPGMHRLRTLPALGPPALLEISLGGHPTEVRFAAKNMIHPQLARASAPRHIRFTNATDRRLTVVLEKVTRPQQMITAGRLYAEFPRFRELTPVLPFFSKIECYRAAILCVSVAEPAPDLATRLARARLTYASEQTTFAVYPSLAALLDDAKPLGLLRGAMPGAYAGVGIGTAFDVDREGRRVPMGSAVDEAFVAMQGAGFGALTLAARLAEDPRVARDLASHEVTTEPHAFTASDGQRLVRLEAS